MGSVLSLLFCQEAPPDKVNHNSDAVDSSNPTNLPLLHALTTKPMSSAPEAAPLIGKAVHFRSEDSSTSLVYPVFSSVQDFESLSPTNYIKALVILHGRKRNASDYYQLGCEIIDAGQISKESAIIIAPQMLDDSDIHYICNLPNSSDLTENEKALRAAPNTYVRWNKDWEAGAPSITVQGTDSVLSSYNVLDDIIGRLLDMHRFPKLQSIVLVGHGGGAQVLIRYAAVIKPQPSRDNMPTISFVIANPGSYLYLTDTRPETISSNDYDNWKYGLADNKTLIPYIANQKVSDRSIRSIIENNFTHQRVTLLLGTKDKKEDGVLDNSPAALTQGPNRYQRGLYYIDSLRENGLLSQSFTKEEVQGVGHDEKSMLLSTQALTAIFQQ